MKQATINDYARMCKAFKHKCGICPMGIGNNGAKELCTKLIMRFPDEANEIILKWCKEHPIKTRQSEFLEMFPNARKDADGILCTCPQFANKDFPCQEKEKCCSDCCKEYWLAEVDENE